MSIKLKASYTTEKERAFLDRLLHPLARVRGARVKRVPGEPNRIYISLEKGEQACGEPRDVV